MVFLAVYGTLKQGHTNHQIHLHTTPAFTGIIHLPVEMYSNGRYPLIIPSRIEHPIHLEIYEIDDHTLTAIDQLEEPFGYSRHQLDLGDFKDVWLYFYEGKELPDNFSPVPSGNFVKEIEWEEG